MAGSVLKRLRGDLQKHDLLRQQSKKRKNVNELKDRREKDRKVLNSLREAFNPFDVKTTRDKSGALNRTVTGQKGQPGVSKQVGETQRKQTYEAQKKFKNRVGGLVDRRFGENNPAMSAEDKMVARYAREKLSRSGKAAMFNLEDDTDVLTHGGQALSFGNDFAEDDLGVEEEPQQTNAVPQEGFDMEGRKKTKHEVMQEIIAKSKKHKAERQQAKAEDEDIVDQLNEQEGFDELLADLKEFDAAKRPEDMELKASADYDQNVREMAFDRRAKPEDRTKTEEELAKERDEDLKEKQKQRQRRMEGDDLDDDFEEEVGNDAELFGLKDDEVHASDAPISEPEAVNGTAPNITSVKIPQKFSQLCTELQAADSSTKRMQQLLKSVDPSTAVGNKEKLERLVVMVAQYAPLARDTQEFRDFASLLREYAPKFNEALTLHFRQTLVALQSKIARDARFSVPDLLLLTLVGTIFSTSDQWNLVANAATLIITQYLSTSMSMAPPSVVVGVYLCDIALLYQRLSKRFIPEVVAYILKVLSAVDGVTQATSLIRTPSSTINLSAKFTKARYRPIELSKLGSVDSDQVILHLVTTCKNVASFWKGFSAYTESFAAVLALLKQLPANDLVAETVNRLEKTIKFSLDVRVPLRLQDLRPMPLVTHAPLFEENYNPEVKNYDMRPDKREYAKMKAEFKKERKQTMKEIRRDAEFVSRERLDENRKASTDYHKMLSRITNQINNEEGAEKNRYERERRARKR